jgi:hypothetical protein
MNSRKKVHKPIVKFTLVEKTQHFILQLENKERRHNVLSCVELISLGRHFIKILLFWSPLQVDPRFAKEKNI